MLCAYGHSLTRHPVHSFLDVNTFIYAGKGKVYQESPKMQGSDSHPVLAHDGLSSAGSRQ